MTPRLLYISEDYFTSDVHHKLLNELGKSGHYDPTVFYSERESYGDLGKVDQYKDLRYSRAKYDIPHSLEKKYKYNFFYKIGYKSRALCDIADCSKFDIIHAATLFSEGAVAYKLHKRYGTPYTVAVRGTDINLYLKYMVHLWPLARKILSNASQVIWTNKQAERYVLSHPICAFGLKGKIKSKSILIHNGIDDFWIQNANFAPREKEARNFIYIGNFSKNKNVTTLMTAFENIAKIYPDVHLTLVGGGGEDEQIIIDKCNSNPDLYTYRGKIFDKSILRDIILANDAFVMVSHSETFGLVYVEALSQNRPVIYTRNQGFDGIINAKVGLSADSKDLNDIVNSILTLINEFSSFSSIQEQLPQFSWANVAKKYQEIFDSILNSKL